MYSSSMPVDPPYIPAYLPTLQPYPLVNHITL